MDDPELSDPSDEEDDDFEPSDDWRDNFQPADDESTAFPASELTPGQAQSRSAYARVREWVDGLNTEDSQALDLPKVLLDHKPGTGILNKKPSWLDEYNILRAEKWTWRKAMYIAWAASPTVNRWPTNQFELARRVLGLKSDRTIRKWRENDPRIDERVAKLQIESTWLHRMDVMDAMTAVAMTIDPKAHPDRRMYLEIAGIYKPKGQLALTNPAGGPVQFEQTDDYEDLSDEQLDQTIVNLEAAS